MHAGGDGEELDRLLARLAEIRKAEGDTRDDFEVHVISYDAYDLDGIKRLEDKGVTDCIVGFRVPYIKGPDTEPLETKIEHLEQVRRLDHQQGEPVSTSTTRGVPRGGRRGREADRQPAVRGLRAGPRRGLRLPRRQHPLLAADGLRLRPRAPGADQPHAPVRPPGARQPRRRLLQRLPRTEGASYVVSGRARHHRRPLLPGDGRDLLRRGCARTRSRPSTTASSTSPTTARFEWRFGPELGLKKGSTLIVREVYDDWNAEDRGTHPDPAARHRRAAARGR